MRLRNKGWTVGDITSNYTTTATGYGNVTVEDSVSGDFLGTGQDQLMVIDNNSLATLYADPLNNSHVVWQHQFDSMYVYATGNISFVPNRTISTIFMAAPDFGGNGTNDLAILWIWSKNYWSPWGFWYTHWEGVWQTFDVKSNKSLPLSGQYDNSGWVNGGQLPMDFSSSGIVAGDLNGDGADELLVELDSFEWVWVYASALALPAYHLMYQSPDGWIYCGGNGNPASLACGDVYGDGQAQVLILTHGGKCWGFGLPLHL